ncbi:hypothetical protein J2Z69_002313 [Paenibacillus shirakamiensis]|uniref:DUF4044 domain-containing protein n=1 Tax=Paenibacillus shirakamiensis TaxID=1265935 RepID=A0ABS4JHR6_9BACL|nr:hypothetical protein [Paenibacillus shirakamiensis]MBP2001270.1 hypothetical protein [Paenibacillus shirakamiensis]
MSTKRIPPTMHQKKEEVNKKLIIWVSTIIGVIVVALVVLLAVSK